MGRVDLILAHYIVHFMHMHEIAGFSSKDLIILSNWSGLEMHGSYVKEISYLTYPIANKIQWIKIE